MRWPLVFYLCAVLSALPFSLANYGIGELISANANLSTLNAIVNQFPGLLENLANITGTLLAPSNDALDAFVSAQGGLPSISPESLQALISYHLLPLTWSSANLSTTGGNVADTRLLDASYANLEGSPNVVFASAYGSTGQETAPSGLKIYSGVGNAATITQPDIAFEGGLVHIIDHVLNFPQTCTKTAETAQLSTLLTAITTTNLTSVVDTTAKFTCFAPTDEAFQRAGINLTALTTEQIVDALKYHSIVGDVGYSTAFEDGREYQTLLGIPVTVHKREGQLFINDAAVQVGNVVMANGVAHVLSSVLSPPSGPKPVQSGGAGASGTSSAAAAGSSSEASTTSSAMSSRMIYDLSIAAFFTLTSGLFLFA